MEQLQASVKSLAAAGETGRRSLDGMIGPVDGAISELSGAASELEGVPFVEPAIGEKQQRVMRGVTAGWPGGLGVQRSHLGGVSD
ncbi:hypothetical protein ATH90_3926 [Pseudomonas lurida]|nr:hypothetical protein ATH90_3926 [Pseudomonas lurida]